MKTKTIRNTFVKASKEKNISNYLYPTYYFDAELHCKTGNAVKLICGNICNVFQYVLMSV